MTIGHISVSLLAGYIASMLFEVPVLGVEKIIFGSKNTKKTIKKHTKQHVITYKRMLFLFLIFQNQKRKYS